MPETETHLILHVKGTEDQTTELPTEVVRAAIAQGEITRSQLIWSTSHNAWKQVRELPHLLPSQQLAPAPLTRPRSANDPLTKSAAFKYQTGSITPMSTNLVKAQVLTPNYQVKEPEPGGFNPFKWICLVLGGILLLVVGLNYLLVCHPLASRMSQTQYSVVTVYSHLGGFMQPGVLVIHVVPSSSITNLNLTDFLVTLAHNTPNAPFSNEPFQRISLSTPWTNQYTISGYAWKELGGMGQEDKAQQKEFLLDQMANISGRPLVDPHATLDDTAQQTARDKAWTAFAESFIRL